MAYFYATIYETLLSLEWLLKTETPGARFSKVPVT